MNRPAGLLIVGLLALGCARTPEQGVEDEGPLPDALSAADSLYAEGQFEGARLIWQAQADVAGDQGDSLTVARLWTSIGLAARNLGDYPESRRIGEAALALKLRLQMAADLFRSYNALGLLAWDQGRLEDAGGLYQQAAAAAARVDDSLSMAKAANNLALVQTAWGELRLAREGYQVLRDVSRRLGDSVSLGRALLNLAMTDLRLGDPLSAVATVEEARLVGRAMGDVEAEENALGQLATAYQALGQPQQAFAAIDSGLQLARTHGFRRRVAEDLQLLGDLYAGAGDHRRALAQYAEAQQLNRELDLPEERGTTLRAEAGSYRALGNPDTAIARARLALTVHREGGFRAAELDDLLLLAELAADRGDRAGAAARLRDASGVAGSLGTAVARAEVALVAARIHDRLQSPAAVLAALDSAGPALGMLSEAARWEPFALRARALARLNRLEAAELAGAQAVAALERIRAGYGSGLLRTSYLSARAEVYADLVVVLLTRGRVEEAFRVADQARGRALLEHLGAGRREIERTGAAGTAADLLRAEELLRRVDALMNQLRVVSTEPPDQRSPESGVQTRHIEDRLHSARAEYEALMARVTREAAGGSGLLAAAPRTVAEVRGALKPGELLVEYLVTPNAVHLFALGPAGLTHSTLPIEAGQLDSRIRLARDLVGEPSRSDASLPVLRELYRILFDPLVTTGTLDGVDRLLVVPHGPLVYLPFAALISSDNLPLVARMPILVLPSASALPALRGPGTRPATATRTGVAMAPLPDRLPASRSEANDVRDVLGKGARALMGGRATEAALRRELGESQVVHVATHGLLNPFNPLFSRIDLAPGRNGGGSSRDDGRLEVHELLGMKVRAGLVYLSGCETGRGAAWRTGFEQGEDYATLAQAFLYAGAGNVVATLWRVDDPAAAVFAGHFYRGLRSGDPVLALADAQRAMQANPSYRSPYYWAAYQITGSGHLEPGYSDTNGRRQ